MNRTPDNIIDDNTLAYLYGPDAAAERKDRIRSALDRFADLFKADGNKTDLHVFRAPGRTEIGGNHTDHQHGQVLAAAIDRDILAVVEVPSDADGMIRLYSEGFGWTEAALSAWTSGRPDQDEPDPAEAGTVSALIHGMVNGMLLRGHQVKGFNAYVTSDVPEGSGLSSSAAFEVLIGTILNELFNGGTISPEEIARMAQAAENRYYGKPCGLMDQTACAVGGLCHMDFHDPASPAVEKMTADLSTLGYRICITNTHGSHADHTDDYIAVQTDLAAAAGVFGKSVLENVSPGEVIGHANAIRQAGGDRAFLRAMHIAAENDRVAAEAAALKQKNMPALLDLIRQSGNSSYKYLQNVYSCETPANQELAVALAISEALLGSSGASRVHGGGFAGTIQAFVPEEMVSQYISAMDDTFGKGSCFVIRICPAGSMQLI